MMALVSPSEPTVQDLRFYLVTAAADLESLIPAWEQLLADSAAPEPMLSPAWLWTWWQTYGSGRELRVGLFYDGDRLVGLAPLCLRPYRYRTGIWLRRLECLGSDVDENDGVCSDYLNLIVARGHEPGVAHAFARELHGGFFGTWDECVLPALDATGPMPNLLNDACRGELTPTGVAPYIDLPKSYDDYLASLPKKKRYQLRQAWRDFEIWAENSWVLKSVKNPDEIERGFHILKSLHETRWLEEGKAGVFSAPRFGDFHRTVMPLFLEAKQLDLFWLEVRGEPVAALYGIVGHGKFYFYQCGRKMDVPGEVRLGIVLLILALRSACERGLREFDFLAGEAFYKAQLASTQRPLVTLRIARGGWRESILKLAQQGIHCVRWVRNWWRRRVN